MSLEQVKRKFNTEEKARRWLVTRRWGRTMTCPRCESDNIQTETKHPQMPYRCRSCRGFFSVKTGTPMEGSNLSLSQWAVCIFLYSTDIRGVSVMNLNRVLGVSNRKSAWNMAHRIREMYDSRPS